MNKEFNSEKYKLLPLLTFFLLSFFLSFFLSIFFIFKLHLFEWEDIFQDVTYKKNDNNY